MLRAPRTIALALASISLVAAFSGAAGARIRTVVREPFNGTAPELPRRWHDIDGDWRRAKGSARIVEGSVSAQTNVAYSVRRLRSSYGKRGMAISAKIRLSPGWSNIGIVGPFRDVGNHLFCKVERTKPHPEGFLAIGRRLNGHMPEILVHQNQIGLVAGERYILKATRKGASTTCSISQSGTRLGRLTYTMRSADRAAFGSGRKVGIRMRLVARGTRRDEDDGRSKFERFTVRTMS
jgi:hypothetical protein